MVTEGIRRPAAVVIYLVCASLSLHAQFAGVHVEEVPNSGIVPGRTYRVFIQVQHDSDQVNVVFGDEKHLLRIFSAQPFYQHPEGGALSTEIHRKRAQEDPKLRFDTWLTIGLADQYDNQTTNFLIDLGEFERRGGEVRTSDGAWFSVPGRAQCFGGQERRVLIGQFTSEGDFSGQLSIMGRTANGETFYAYDVNFSSTSK